ncbi:MULTISPECIES: hypothetical protein [Halorussus]|uniref:hypothetical protein n=1 Tax=Halorussus TaxID=1070314 RepID=UPI0020A0A752|nr:hypothetical protein [Halorussus vallis]USZ78639.1 hypothetical protein NGM07_25150 [Halorussus vallis]USZ78670.1 hypothetical protein NGM07_24480 [Halorussus vallis]
MEPMYFIPIAVLVAVVVGNLLFGRYSGGSHTLAATFGLVRNVGLALVGILTMMGGTWFHIAVGMTLLTASWYLGRGHASRLDGTNSGSLRGKLNG